MKLNNENLVVIKGGSITSSMLNAISSMISNVFDIGKSIGSSIRRIYSKNIC